MFAQMEAVEGTRVLLHIVKRAIENLTVADRSSKVFILSC